ncbi:DUF2855 family protein [Henriciella mobilis]|uniref:DUF2855 family protein n=1 Tax=Henriciella mobilis TaxID=2305467 RepID=A0A399RFI9_9PROT|nr:DUF2855 family protein [Henriciella mobilis]RIJ29254.1 DUF2855 family protein [Henriciella mobilis]
MSDIKELLVNRSDYRKTRAIERPQEILAPRQIRVAVEKFAITSNNVSYAVSGDAIGYWRFFPAEEGWGKVPVWGIGKVVESQADSIKVGEKLYGYFPMSSEAVLTVGKVSDDSFMEASPHRADLAAVYNNYRRLAGEPEAIQALEDERCLYFPLFITSYVLYDYLTDNDYFGAKQIVIGSVSSKTAFGLAQLLHEDRPDGPRVIGFTSPGNRAFVESLNCCDDILLYGEEAAVDASVKTAYVDMSGNRELTGKLHRHLGDNMVESCMVGATHWEKRGVAKDLPGAKPTFFFAPAQIAKRNKEWGPGVLYNKAGEASARLARSAASEITVERISGADAIADTWRDFLDNKVAPSRGIMASL